MKELTIEEKAQKYDNLIKRLKNSQSEYRFETIDKYFPELKESEENKDDRIRKSIIEFVQQNKSFHYLLGVSKEDAVAWLKKQGEHEPADVEEPDFFDDFRKTDSEVKPKFHEGDWIVFNGLTLYVKEVVKGFYRTISIDGIPNSYDWDIDNAARLWTIQDAKDGDVLFIEIDSSTCIFKKLEGNLLYSYIISDGKLLVENSHYYYETDDNVYPATKEQRNLLFQKMKEAGLEWDVEKKELKKIEQKPTWSEEDENLFNKCIIDIQMVDSDDTLKIWLKSLKDRIQLKQNKL